MLEDPMDARTRCGWSIPVVGSFRAAAERAVGAGDELRGLLRGVFEDVPERIIDESIATLRYCDGAVVEAATARLARAVPAALRELERFRCARVRALLDRERHAIEELGDRPEQRAFELADETAVWRRAL